MAYQGVGSAPAQGGYTNLGDLEPHNVLFQYPVPDINPLGERRFTFSEMVHLDSIIKQRAALMQRTGGDHQPWRSYIDKFERELKWRPRQFRLEAFAQALSIDPKWWYEYDMFLPLEEHERLDFPITAPEPPVHGSEQVGGSEALKMEKEAVESPSMVPRHQPIRSPVENMSQTLSPSNQGTQEPGGEMNIRRTPMLVSNSIESNEMAASQAEQVSPTFVGDYDSGFQAQGPQGQIQSPGSVGELPPQLNNPHLDSGMAMAQSPMQIDGEMLLQPFGFQNQPMQEPLIGGLRAMPLITKRKRQWCC